MLSTNVPSILMTSSGSRSSQRSEEYPEPKSSTAIRTPLTQAAVTTFLSSVDLYAMPASIYADAGRLAGANLGTLDALHLAVALRQRCDAMVTYDTRLSEAAVAHGLEVVAPS